MIVARRRLRAGAMGAGLVAGAVVWALVQSDGLHHLRQLAGAALTPVGLTWLLLGALAGLLWHRRQRRPAPAAGACWLLLSLAGNPQLAALQFALLEGSFSSSQRAEETPLDALLVLGGGVAITASGRVTLGDAAERVTWPVRLYRQGVAVSLVSSGPTLAEGLPPARPSRPPRPASYPEAAAGLWTSLGVAPEHVMLLPGPRTTREEIDAHRRLVDEGGWQRAGLITSAWYMRRALRPCRRVGLDVHPLPCDARGDPPRWRWRHVIPSSGAVEATCVAWIETLAWLAGR